jgi:hypothetical protein
MRTGAPGGASTEGQEEMEDPAEMEEDSTSNVSMLAADGAFIAGTADGTVTEARHSSKRHRAAENMSEDLLNRHIQDYGLVSPERTKNLVWYFFKKYGTKKLNRQNDNNDLTLLVFIHEALPLLRKIRALKILQESLGVL